MRTTRIKIFSEDGSSRVEDKINQWLKEADIDDIISIHQSQHPYSFTVSILYYPKPPSVLGN